MRIVTDRLVRTSRLMIYVIGYDCRMAIGTPQVAGIIARYYAHLFAIVS